MNDSQFLSLIKQNKINLEIIQRLSGSEIPDLWLVSGSLFQTVWNIKTNRSPVYGIKDYDLFYFDSSDLSWEAEDKVIKTIEKNFDDLDAQIEIRNQARVHLWYEKKFKITYPALENTKQGIDRFLAKACMVGINLNSHKLNIYAPNGFEDLDNMVIRPNRTKNFQMNTFTAKVNNWTQKWPELKIIM